MRKLLKRATESEYQFAGKYHFCEGCEFKTTIHKDGKLVRYNCPARFDPYEPMIEPDGSPRQDGRGCPKHERFMKMEADKHEATRYQGREVL